jgi:hypothetical protein
MKPYSACMRPYADFAENCVMDCALFSGRMLSRTFDTHRDTDALPSVVTANKMSLILQSTAAALTGDSEFDLIDIMVLDEAKAWAGAPEIDDKFTRDGSYVNKKEIWKWLRETGVDMHIVKHPTMNLEYVPCAGTKWRWLSEPGYTVVANMKSQPQPQQQQQQPLPQ